MSYVLGEPSDTPSLNAYGGRAFVGWVITLPSGVQLTFNQPEVSSASVVGYPGHTPTNSTTPRRVINKWFITQITFPDSPRNVAFSYTTVRHDPSKYHLEDSGFEFIGLGGPTQWISEGYAENTFNSPREDVLLSRIDAADQTIRFIYQHVSDFDGSRLTQIAVHSPTGNLLKRIQLGYEDLGDGRWLLKDVAESDPDNTIWSGKHQFEYNSLSVPTLNYFPYNNLYTTGVDHWGYFNGVKAGYRSLIPTLPYTQLNTNQPLQPSISTREPNANTMQGLSLRKVWLPTGGYNEYTFEPNDYSYISDGTTKSSRILAGGLRIRQIKKHDGRNAASDITAVYEYALPNQGNLSSGVVENEPMYQYQHTNTYVGMPNLQRTNIHKSNPILPIEIGYSYVTEKRSDGSKTIYRFSTSKDYPYASYPLLGEGAYTVYYDSPANCMPAQKTNHPFARFKGRYDYMRGLPLEKIMYDVNGDAVYSEEYRYQAHEVAHLPALNQFWSFQSKRDNGFHLFMLGFIRYQNISLGKPRLLEFTRLQYHNGSPRALTTKTTYTYSFLHDWPRQVITTRSTGEQDVIQYYYPVDYNPSAMDGALQRMLARNICDKPVEVRAYRNGQVVSGHITEYDPVGLGLPVRQYKLEASAPIANLGFDPNNHLVNANYYKQHMTWAYSPNLLTPLAAQAPGGSAFSTLWDYNGARPIATIQGAPVQESRQITNGFRTTTTTITGDATLTSLVLNEEAEYQFITNLQLNAPSKYGKAPLKISLENTVTHQVLHKTTIRMRQTAETYQFWTVMQPGTYAIRCWYPTVGSTNSSINVNVTVHKAVVRRTAFHTSFEEDTDAILGSAKTGLRAHAGAYKVLVPTRAGTYKVSYWTRPSSGNNTWTYQERTLNIPGSDDQWIGDSNELLDEVRLQPLGAMMTTYTYHPVFGKTSETTPAGLTTRYEHDKLGRPEAVRNDDGDIVRTYERYIQP